MTINILIRLKGGDFMTHKVDPEVIDKADEVLNKRGLLTTREAAALLGFNPQRLINMRARDQGPTYFKNPGGRCFYSRKFLKEWLLSCMVVPNKQKK
jgi:hypothetical protein